MNDYIIPGFIAKALRRPSYRTQLESTMVGLIFMMLTALGTSTYFVFFSDMNIWFKILSGIGGIGAFLFLGSNLATTYIQYYTFKKQMGLYPIDEQLIIKIQDACALVDELKDIIDKNVKQVEDDIKTIEENKQTLNTTENKNYNKEVDK